MGESSHLWVQVQLRPAALVMCTPRGSPFPCPPFVPALHCLREGQVTEMSTHALAQCPELRVPLPLCPWVTYLFIIYLFKVYLSYLLVFIDGWKSGGHFCCMAGAAGSPPPSPLRFRVLLCVWEHRWGGILVVPVLLSPFGAREGERRGIMLVPAGKTPRAHPLPTEAQSLCTPSPCAVLPPFPICIY